MVESKSFSFRYYLFLVFCNIFSCFQKNRTSKGLAALCCNQTQGIPGPQIPFICDENGPQYVLFRAEFKNDLEKYPRAFFNDSKCPVTIISCLSNLTSLKNGVHKIRPFLSFQVQIFNFFFQKFFFILINFLGDSDHFYTYKRSKCRFLAVLWPF